MIATLDQLLTAAYLAIGWQPHTWFAIFVWLNLADAGISAHALRLHAPHKFHPQRLLEHLTQGSFDADA